VASAKLSFVPTVKVLFDTDDPAAVAEWTLLSDHASDAGFRLMNISAEDPSLRYNNNAYDVYIGKAPQMGVGFGSIQQLVNGPNRMPMEQFLGLTAEVIAADSKTLDAKLQDLDKKLFELGIGLPLYQVPTLLVYNQRIKGLVADPTASNFTWGYWTWKVSPDK
jgi:peptide/nickel transport system substrate-binding protein